jgi:AAA+ superfamily predicted ATPase
VEVQALPLALILIYLIMKAKNQQILQHIETVVSEFSIIGFNDLNKEQLKSFNAIALFYGVDINQSVLLAIIIKHSLLNEEVTLNLFLGYFNGRLSQISSINENLNLLIKKGYVNSKTTGRHSKAISKQTFHIETKVLNATINSNSELLKVKPSETIDEFLDCIKNEFQKREDGYKDASSFVTRVDELIQENKHFNEIGWVNNQNDWSSVDKTVFLTTSVNHIIEKKSLDLEHIIKQVIDVFSEQFSYRNSIVNKTNPLMIGGYLEFKQDDYLFDEFISLSDKSMKELFPSILNIAKEKEVKPTMGLLISPESIIEEKLYYNESEESQINTLKNILNPENYSNVVKQLEDSDLSSGVNILLHGYAGTGKTATVKQFAKQTNRHVFMIEIEKIKSRWVGDSEKNLKKVFNEYRELMKSLPEIPILLFNEADAIIGKRVEIRNSTDKSFNTLQNLLLQEFEDFKGISFSTTNLASHLDKAFERRFLYKVEFNKPSDKVRNQIINTAFKDIHPETISKVVSNFELTGGQISNIKKKLLLKSIVDGEVDKEAAFFQLCKEELSLESNKTKSIGY